MTCRTWQDCGSTTWWRPNSLHRRAGMVAESSKKGTNVSIHAKRRHKRTKELQKMLGRRKFQSVKREWLHMQVRQVFSSGTPNGMNTLWPCVGLSCSNQSRPTAHGTTLTLNSPSWGYKHPTAPTQCRPDSKCRERATLPQVFHRSLGKGKEWVKETSSGSTGTRYALAVCWADNASRTQSSAASRAQDWAARWRELGGLELCSRGTACRRRCSSSLQKGRITHCSWDPRDKAKSCSSGSSETSARSSTGL